MAMNVDSSTDHGMRGGLVQTWTRQGGSKSGQSTKNGEMVFLIFLKEIVYITLNITKLPISVTFTLYFLRLVNETADRLRSAKC